MYTTNSNAEWAKERGVGATPYPPITDVSELQANPQFAVVTPADCVELVSALGPGAEITLHPLMGGLAPDVGTASLELFTTEVLPELAQARRVGRPERLGASHEHRHRRCRRDRLRVEGPAVTGPRWRSTRCSAPSPTPVSPVPTSTAS